MSFVSKLLALLIRTYQLTLSPLLPASCRFTPSCSEYALDAVAKRGPLTGAGLALWRIARCNPWGGFGYDPVPEAGKSSNSDLASAPLGRSETERAL